MYKVIEINVADMGGLMTAEKAKAIATSWKNEELQKALKVILNKVEEVAERGGLEVSVAVSCGRPIHFYDTLYEFLRNLGYRIDKPIEPDRGGNSKMWNLKWS